MPNNEITSSKVKSNQNQKSEELTCLSQPMTTEHDSLIDLSDIFRLLWKEKRLIILVTSFSVLLSIAIALYLPNTYKASVILSPTSQGNMNGLDKLAGQFGGLASMAGISLGGGQGEDKTIIAIELLKTWGFLESFVNENQIQEEVIATKGWDRKENKLIYDLSIYNPKTKTWASPEFELSSWEVYKKLNELIYINQDKSTGLVTISVEHYSPYLAKEWLDKLVLAINTHLKKRDIENANKMISYLNKKVAETNITEMQSIFYQLIEEQTKTLMLAEVSDEYVFKTISVAKVPEEKSGPKRALMVIVGVLLGFLFSVLIVFFKSCDFKR